MLQSKLFGKTSKSAPQDEKSFNAQLLIKAGFIDKLAAGVYSFLPLGRRVMEKIIDVIREEMDKIGGQEILMPAIHPKEAWDATGRWDTDVMFHLKSQSGKEYGLGWTHEEIVTPLVQKFNISYKDLPVAVYQIQPKFRDELRAKSGILRTREFIMKDLYSFHKDEKDLDAYYETARQSYLRIFQKCGLGDYTYVTFASGGAFSKFSHEFQAVTDAGEDLIYICDKCNVAVNKEVLEELKHTCPLCESSDLREKKAIEVGNIFKLKSRFTDAFRYEFMDETGASKPVIMGCYGIGPARVMGAAVEILHDQNGIVWPKAIAPYQVHLVSLGQDSACGKIYQALVKEGVEVLFDDREESAGVKLKDADLIGIPIRAVVSSKTGEKIEIKYRDQQERSLVSLDTLIKQIQGD